MKISKKTWWIVGILLLVFGIGKLILFSLYWQPQTDTQVVELKCAEPGKGCALPGGGQLKFDTLPQTEQPFAITLQGLGKDVPAPSADFVMTQMDMGKNQYRFVPAGNDWQAHVTLPACHSGALDWVMTLRIGQRIYRLPFTLQPIAAQSAIRRR